MSGVRRRRARLVAADGRLRRPGWRQRRPAIDVHELHVYAADWTVEQVSFFVDEELVKTVRQSPSYPMQLMLGIYEFGSEYPGPRTGAYPKKFVVDYVRGYRPAAG